MQHDLATYGREAMNKPTKQGAACEGGFLVRSGVGMTVIIEEDAGIHPSTLHGHVMSSGC